MSVLGTLGVGVNFDLTQVETSVAKLNRSMKVIDTSMKATSSSFGRVTNSSEKLEAQINGLNKKYDVQEKKVELQRKKYEELTKAKGADSAETQRAEIQLNKSVETLNQLEGEISDVTEEYKSLTSESAKVRKENKTLQDSFRNIESQVNNLSDSLIRTGDGMKDFGNKMSTRVSLPIVGAFVASAKSAIDWESSFAGVRKTVDGSGKDFEMLGKGIRDMARGMPQSADGLAEIAEMAGQLGIETPSILDFTNTIADLGESTNMTTEQAATEFSRFANIVGMSQDDFGRMGSAIVELGNNLATTESEIMSMSMRLAGVGEQVGMSETQILALSGVMSSLGIEAESGGTAMTTVMKKMQNAVSDGGADLDAFATASGMSAQSFAEAFQADPMNALTGLIEGLEQTSAEGGNLNGVLETLGIKGIRESDALLRLVGSSDLLVESLEMSANAWEENSALSDEAQQRYDTLASQLSILKNNVVELGIQIGDRLTPFIEKMADAVKNAVTWFDELDEGTKDVVVIVGGVVAAIGPLLVGLGSLMGLAGLALKPIGALFGTLATLGVGGTLMAIGKGILRFLGPVGLLFGAFLVVKDALDGMGLSFGDFFGKAKGFVEGMWDLFTGNKVEGKQILETVGLSQETIDKLVGFTEGLKIEYEKLKIRVNAFKNIFTGEGTEEDDKVLAKIGLPPNMTEKMAQFSEDFGIFIEKMKIYMGAIFNILTGNMGASEEGILKKLGLSDELIYALGNIFGTVRGLVESGIGLVLGLFTGDGDRVANALAGFGITPEMSGTIEDIYGGIKGFIEGIIVVVSGLVKNIGSSAMPLIEDIIVYMSDLFDRLRGFWDENGTAIIETLNKIGAIVGPILGVVLGAVNVAIPLIFTVIRMVFENIKGFLDGIFGVIGGAVELITGIFTGDFSKMWEGIKSIFFGAFKVVWNGFQLLFVGRLVKGALGFIKGIIGFFKGFSKDGTNIFKAFGTGTLNIFKNIWNWVVNTVKGFVDNVIGYFSTFRSKTSSIFESVRVGLTLIWDTIKFRVTNIVHGMVRGVVNRITGMKNNVIDGVKSIKNRGIDLFNKFKDEGIGKIKTLADDVVDMFKKLPGRVGNGIKNMASKAWDGIKSFGNYMGKKLASVVNAVIGGINGVTTSIGVKSDLPLVEPKKFSRGTRRNGGGGHEGGLMTVGDHGPGNSGLGQTREIVQYPNGGTAMFDKETTMYAPKGTTVFSNKETERIMSSMRYSTGTKNGGGGLLGKGADFIRSIGQGAKDAWELVSNPSKLIGNITEGLLSNFNDMPKFPKDLSKGLFNKVKEGAKNFLVKTNDETSPKVSGSSLFPGFGLNYDYGKYPFDFNGGNHYGQDYSHVYDAVRAPLGGTVTRNFWDNGGGKAIEIQSGKIYQLFMHMQESIVRAGQTIKSGQKIGTSGNTGANTTGPHLHYQIHTNPNNFNASSIHPRTLLSGGGAKGGAGGGSGIFDYYTGGLINQEGVYRLGERGSEAVIPLENKGVAAMMLDYINEVIGNDGSKNRRPNRMPKPKGGSSRDEGYELMKEQNSLLSKMVRFMESQLEKQDEEIGELRAIKEQESVVKMDGRTTAKIIKPHLNKENGIEDSRGRRYRR